MASHPIQKFNFHGDELDVVCADGEPFVVLARLCAPFGLRVDGQAEKLRGLTWARTQKIWVRDPRGQEQDVVCLSIRSVAGWLFTLNAGKVAPHLRDKLALYQRECADVLADHFLGRRGAVAQPDLVGQLVATLEEMRARLAALESREPFRPSLGAAAKLHVLDPLKEIAAIEARAVVGKDPRALAKLTRSMRTVAEDTLRERLDYRRRGGQSWAMFPQVRLGELHCALVVLRHEAMRRARAHAPAPTQLRLVHSA